MNMTDIISMIVKLTSEKKLEWKPVGNAYRTKVGDVGIGITPPPLLRVVVYNNKGEEVDSTTPNMFNNDSIENQLLHLVRRQILKTDETLSDLADMLKKIDENRL